MKEKLISARKMQAVFKTCVSFTCMAIYDQHDSTHSKGARRVVRIIRLLFEYGYVSEPAEGLKFNPGKRGGGGVGGGGPSRGRGREGDVPPPA